MWRRLWVDCPGDGLTPGAGKAGLSWVMCLDRAVQGRHLWRGLTWPGGRAVAVGWAAHSSSLGNLKVTAVGAALLASLRPLRGGLGKPGGVLLCTWMLLSWHPEALPSTLRVVPGLPAVAPPSGSCGGLCAHQPHLVAQPVSPSSCHPSSGC